MTYSELRERAFPALVRIQSMGKWDRITLDVQDGEPVVVATIWKGLAERTLIRLGIMSAPSLPERVAGIRCRTLIVPSPKIQP